MSRVRPNNGDELPWVASPEVAAALCSKGCVATVTGLLAGGYGGAPNPASEMSQFVALRYGIGLLLDADRNAQSPCLPRPQVDMQ
jgi:hypothetical protein